MYVSAGIHIPPPERLLRSLSFTSSQAGELVLATKHTSFAAW